MRNNETEAQVKLELEIDNQTIIIDRKIEKSGKYMSKTETRIAINNEVFEGSVTEIKNKILSLLNYPPEFAKKTNDLFRFTVYTPQEEMKQIIMESNDTRLNTLRHVFGIDKYKRVEENIDLLTSKIRQEIRLKEVEKGSLEQKNQLVKEKQTQLAEQQLKIIEVDKEANTLTKIRQDKQHEIDELTNKINEKKKLEYEKDKRDDTIKQKRNSKQ